MADGEDIQPLVCDNGTGMVKVNIVIFVDLMNNVAKSISKMVLCSVFDLGWFCWR